LFFQFFKKTRISLKFDAPGGGGVCRPSTPNMGIEHFTVLCPRRDLNPGLRRSPQPQEIEVYDK